MLPGAIFPTIGSRNASQAGFMSPKPRTAFELHRARLPMSERKNLQDKAIMNLSTPKHKQLEWKDLEPEKK